MNSKMQNAKNKCRDQKTSCPLAYDHLQLPYLQDACRSAGFQDNRKVRTHRLHWEWHKFIASSQNWSDVDKGIWPLNHLDQQNLVGQILMINQIPFAIQSAYQICGYFLGYLFVIVFSELSNSPNFPLFFDILEARKHRLHGRAKGPCGVHPYETWNMEDMTKTQATQHFFSGWCASTSPSLHLFASIFREKCHFLFQTTHLVGGWTNPPEKYAHVKLDHFPRDRGEY